MLSTFISLLALASSTTAVCTGFRLEFTSEDTGSGFSTTYSQTLSNLACPFNATKDCEFRAGQYFITANRDLVGRGLRSYNDLPSDEVDAIFSLAQNAFFDRYRNTSNLLSPNFSSQEGNVTFDSTSTLRDVKPGTNLTLVRTSFYRRARGVLSGCSNSTLNNMTITAAAPYLTKDRNNRTEIAGTWGTYSQNFTHNDTSAASGRADARTLLGASLAVMVVGLVL